MKRKKKNRKFTFIIITAAILILWWLFFPSVLFKNPVSSVIVDKENQLLGATIAADGQWRFPDRNTVPVKFEKCIITYEDKRFYYHPGVDIIALARSLIHNLKSASSVQGGSTISMQVMRLSHKNESRTIWQKLIESVQAVRLECTYSKNKILALYASHAPFGGNVVGLDAASWRYFGRKPEDLSWGEMATLAVLPNSPALIHPGRNRKILLEKRNSLLKKLTEKEIIDRETFELALQEPLPDKPFPLPQYAPHLLQLYKLNSSSRNREIGHSTIDFNLQKKVTEIVGLYHEVLKGNAIRNLCALVLDVETGKALAYVGNITSDNPDDKSYVDVIQAPRSPGSTLKPILFAAAMSDGQLLPEMLLPDVPTQIAGYTPQNFDRSYDGAVPASQALSRSLNIPAVKILQQYKYERFYSLLRKLGITTLTRPAGHYGLSMILGGSEVTLWDLAGVYAGMARVLNHASQNEGKALKKDFFAPSYLQNAPPAKNTDNEVLPELDATSVWFTFQSMQELMRPGEEGLWQQFIASKRIAWKTGTSFGFRDAWAIGVTTKYVVGVWVGNADGEGRPELLGVKAAAPVMFDIFRQLPLTKDFPQPQSGFSFPPVCRQTGFRAGLDCTEVDTLMAPPNGNKTITCPYHQTIHLDPTGQYRVTNSCLPVSQMTKAGWFVLPPTMEWYYRRLHPDYKELPPFMKGCSEELLAKMELVYPTKNSKVYVPLEIDGQRGKMICMATHRNLKTKIFWHLDGEFLGTTSQFHQMAISPPPGRHTLTLVDESGESINRNFEILEPGSRSF